MLTIGEFSRLGRVSPRMLRYYDAFGLLCPEAVGENGYRYYRQEQLARLLKLQRLQGYGFSLAEVKELLKLNEEALLQRLHRRRLDAHYEIYRQQERLRRLEADILQMEGTSMLQDKYEVILMPDPEQTVFGIRRTVPVAKFHDLFQELWGELANRGLEQAGPIQMLYHSEEFDYENADVEVQAVVKPGPNAKIKPAYDLCATVLHKGPYDGLPRAYEALASWMAQHPEYRICGPAIDRYLNDPDATPPEELATGVLFPLEKC
ncbi:MAG: MerR family transcriptional regulator [Oscillospiraceae bacterium]|nr:MerR family transcriptional regulator [Oscillospiraceae bacterium]